MAIHTTQLPYNMSAERCTAIQWNVSQPLREKNITGTKLPKYMDNRIRSNFSFLKFPPTFSNFSMIRIYYFYTNIQF